MKLRLIPALAALLMSAAPALAANVPLIPTQPTSYFAAAGGSWAVGATTITLAATCPSNIPVNAAVVDDTGPTNRAIGNVLSCVGTTLTLQAATNFASVSANDVLAIGGVQPPNFSEPSQVLASLNSTIQSINTATPGLITSLQVPLNPSSTSAVTALSTAVTLNVGQAIRVKAWGVNGGSVSTNTISIVYGASSSTTSVAVTGTSANWWVECELSNVGTTASPKVISSCYGAQGSTLITTTTTTDTSDIASNAQTLSLTTTASVASQQTINGAFIEYVR
jgi:hypothetical protein